MLVLFLLLLTLSFELRLHDLGGREFRRKLGPLLLPVLPSCAPIRFPAFLRRLVTIRIFRLARGFFPLFFASLLSLPLVDLLSCASCLSLPFGAPLPLAHNLRLRAVPRVRGLRLCSRGKPMGRPLRRRLQELRRAIRLFIWQMAAL